MPLVAAIFGAVLLISLVLTVKLRPWDSFNLVQTAQAEMRQTISSKAVAFPNKPDMRTAVYATGRPDLRVVCGWVTTQNTSTTAAEPHFFYVLYQLRLAWVSRETVFLQTRSDEVSPGWGETWCRGKPLG